MSAKILIEDSDEVSGVSTGDTGDKRNDRKSYWIEEQCWKVLKINENLKY